MRSYIVREIARLGNYTMNKMSNNIEKSKTLNYTTPMVTLKKLRSVGLYSLLFMFGLFV
jgi:hypothetical protein